MILHIVEPTLRSYVGHCHSLVNAIAGAAPVEQVQIWAGKGSDIIWQGQGQLQPYFYRPLRRLQAFFLYRRLLRLPGIILLSTAGTSDLISLNWAAKETIPAAKVYLYMHWVGAKASKVAKLAEIAKLQPNLEILCPTREGATFFQELGFRSRLVPYPVNSLQGKTFEARPFSHLVVAGGARADKGFERVVALAEMLERRKAAWPLWVQVSAPHRDKHPAPMLALIDRLTATRYANLTVRRETLTPPDYQALFPGGISIQPYAQDDFQDRVSGVALDALGASCPIVTTANTWLARLVLRFDAGVVTSDLSPAGLIRSIEQVLADYIGYAQRAAIAGQALKSEHSVNAMMRAIFGEAVLSESSNQLQTGAAIHF